MPSSLMSGCAEAFMLVPHSKTFVTNGSYSYPLSETNARELIPSRHVGQDYLISFAEPTKHFDGVDRAASELHLRALGFAGCRIELEEANGALFLSERRPTNVQNVVQPFELDRPVDAEI